MDEKKALLKCADWCSRQERCISEVRDKLVRMGVDSQDVGSIIERLVEEKYIDEKRYISFYINDKFRFNGWGRIKIRYQLASKGLNADDVEDAICRMDEEEYESALYDLLASKKKTMRNKDVWQQKTSLVRYAYSRGFEYECIKRVLARLNIRPADDSDDIG